MMRFISRITGKQMLLCLGAALLFTAVSTPAAIAQQKVSESKAASAEGLVKISNIAGSVKVSGWNRNEVSVEGTLGEGTERLDFDVRGSETNIKVVIPDEKTRREKGITRVDGSDLTIRVPDRSRLEITTVSASVSVSDVSGNLHLESVSGKIEVSGTPSRVSAKSVSGDINIEECKGSVRANTVAGRITVQGAVGRMEVGTISGEVRASLNDIEEGSFNSLSGNMELEGELSAGASIEVDNHSGNITIKLPTTISADFDITTFSGNIKNALSSDQAENRSRFGPGRSLSFVMGSGDARIRITNFSGGVFIQKK